MAMMEQLLDTSRACFLCLQEMKGDVNSAVLEVNLHSICRCLNINTLTIIRDPLSENSEQCGLSVKMCSTCGSTTNRLTNLINEIEMMKDFLTNQLQVFYEALSSSNQKPQSLDRSKPGVTKEPETGLVEQLRTVIKEKCPETISQIEASKFPKVRLERLVPETESLPNADEAHNPITDLDDTLVKTEDEIIVPSPLTISESFTILPSPFQGIPSIHPPTTDEYVLPAEISSDPLSIPVVVPPEESPPDNVLHVDPHEQMISDLCKKNSTQTGNTYRCSVCDFTTTNIFSSLRRHMVNAHPQIFLASGRPAHVNNVTFQNICTTLLSKEISQAKEHGNIIDGKQCFPCEYCNRKYFLRNKLKDHLILDHLKIMEEKLNHQISGLPFKSTKSGETKSWVCGPGGDGCGQFYSSKTALCRHQKESCVHRNSQKAFVCGGDNGCGLRFSCRYSLTRHLRKKICGNTNSLEAKDAQSKDPIPEPGAKTLKKKIKKTWICSVEDGGCGQAFKKNWGLQKHRRSHCLRLGRRETWTCEKSEGGCGLHFSNKDCLKRHQKESCAMKMKRFDKKKMEPQGHTDGNAKAADDFIGIMECTVESVTLSKIEVMDTHE